MTNKFELKFVGEAIMYLLRWIQLIYLPLILILTACGGGGSSDDPEPESKLPETVINSPANGSVFAENATISFTGVSTDKENRSLVGSSLEWSSNSDGVFGTGADTSTVLSVGSHNITLEAADSDGGVGSNTVTITVNAAPMIENTIANPNVVVTGDSTVISWSVVDTEGDTLTCSLDVNGDGTVDYTIDDCDNNTSQSHTYSVPGEYSLSLTVSDAINVPVQQGLSITVSDPVVVNVPPTVSRFDSDSSSLEVGESLSFGWSVSDDGDALICSLDAGDGSAIYTIDNCANNISQTHTYTQSGTFLATFTVSDGINSVEETFSVSVTPDDSGDQEPPFISGFTTNTDLAYTTVAATFYWQVSDPDGDTLTCLLDVDGDGSDDYSIQDCANDASQNHAYGAVGDYTARLTVSDGVSSVQQTVSLGVRSHLVLDVTANETVEAGGRALYTITVSNTSAVPVNGVAVLFPVPAELSFIFSTDAEPNAACGTTVCSANLEANWALGTLAVGDSVTITIDALVSSDTSAGTLITAPVRVTSSDVIDHVNRISVIAVEAGE